MKSKHKLIWFLLATLLFSGFLSIILSAKGIQKEDTISTIADKDTYVKPSISNYGGLDSLYVGFRYDGICEAYFHFNFSNRPSSYIRAGISLDFYGVSQTMNFTVCQINSSWDELTLNWYNKPEKGEKITNLIVSGSGIITFDVTKFISGVNSLSICIYLDDENFVDDYVYITSREGYYSWFPEDAPQLLWYYWETYDITITSPTSSNNWKEGNTYSITWTTRGPIENVIIELYRNNQEVVEITFLFTENDGSYDFYCAAYMDYDASTNYRIKITDYDNSDVYGYSEYFSINYQEPFDYTDIILGLIIFLGIVSFIGIIIYLSRHQSKKRRIIETPPHYNHVKIPPPSARQVSQNINAKVKFCIKCGSPNEKENKFCIECGTEMVI